jgi:hypothetical protein
MEFCTDDGDVPNVLCSFVQIRVWGDRVRRDFDVACCGCDFQKLVSPRRRRCRLRLMDWGDGVGDGQQDERGPKGDAVEVGGQWREDGRGVAGQEKIGE